MQRGMTLLELVVALAVTGLLLAAGYGAFASVVDHQHAVEQATDGVSRAAALRRMLASWLGGARLTAEPGGPPFQGLDEELNGTPDDRVSFLTTARTPAGAGEAVIEIYIDRDEPTPQRGLVARITPWPQDTGAVTVELEPHVAGLDIRYLSGVLGRRQWMPSWISTSVLPTGVELTLLSPPGDSLEPLLRIPVRVPLGAGR